MKTRIAIIVSSLAVLVAAALIPRFIAPDWATRGQFGDSFGLLNAVASSLALVMVAITLRLQGQQLEIQRKELELTRQELARTAEAQESSASRLADQLSHMIIASQINGLNTLLQSVDSEIAVSISSFHALPESTKQQLRGYTTFPEHRKTERDSYRARINALLESLKDKSGTSV
jgi:hypothetical protein